MRISTLATQIDPKSRVKSRRGLGWIRDSTSVGWDGGQTYVEVNRGQGNLIRFFCHFHQHLRAQGQFVNLRSNGQATTYASCRILFFKRQKEVFRVACCEPHKRQPSLNWESLARYPSAPDHYR